MKLDPTEQIPEVQNMHWIGITWDVQLFKFKIEIQKTYYGNNTKRKID